MRHRGSTRERRSRQRPRRAAVLLVVLVVVVLLALGAYTFSETMISEYQAVTMHARKVESRVLADSGVQYAAAMLQQRFDFAAEDVFDNPEQLQDILLTDSQVARGRGRFSVIAPPRFSKPGTLRFGLTDESSKLNLNVLASRILKDKLPEDEARTSLLRLPGMTAELADAILDWLDDDDIPRRFGAETEYYADLPSPYVAKNGPLETLDELLQVRGLATELLYGRDANRNGLIDPHEQAAIPAGRDVGVDLLARGWQALLTVRSRERNVRRDGRRKINVNQESLERLFEEVSLEFGDDLAEFVVEVRRRNQKTESSTAGGSTVGRIESIFDLIGSAFAADGDTPAWESPWTTEPADMRSYLPTLLDTLTTHVGPSREGRVNINRAPRPVLLAVPGMTDSLADVIIAAQQQASAFDDRLGTRATTAWLLIEGHVDVAKMRQLDRYISARGDVYSGQVIGYFDAGETVTRLAAMIDATYLVPRVVSLQDFTDLGPGVTRQQLKRLNSLDNTGS